jgi:hypothetical protein
MTKYPQECIERIFLSEEGIDRESKAMPLPGDIFPEFTPPSSQGMRYTLCSRARVDKGFFVFQLILYFGPI